MAGGSGLMRLPAPESVPIRKMLAHPSIVKRLNWMLGGGFRANTHGGLIEWRGDWGDVNADSDGHRFHAGGHPLLPEFNYHLYQWNNGRSHAGSVNCAWQLTPGGSPYMYASAIGTRYVKPGGVAPGPPLSRELP